MSGEQAVHHAGWEQARAIVALTSSRFHSSRPNTLSHSTPSHTHTNTHLQLGQLGRVALCRCLKSLQLLTHNVGLESVCVCGGGGGSLR